MSIRLPDRNLAGFCRELIESCSASQKDRTQRGALFRNLYLSGDSTGMQQTYPKTNSYLDSLAAHLYAPFDLRYTIHPDDPGQPNERAMANGAARELMSQFREPGVNVDMAMDAAVVEALLKGKSFLQLLYTQTGGGRRIRFEPSVLSPEYFGVLREDLPTLSSQEAFFFSTYITLDRFTDLVARHPDRDALIRAAKKHINPSSAATGGPGPERNTFLKQVVIGGMNPYRSADDAAASSNQGLVNWLGGPAPTFDPSVLAQLIRIDELWIQDSEMEDWTTIQLMDDELIEGKYIHRNLFADPGDITDRDLLKRSRDSNPLAGRHPFIEFCANELKGYFWGRSELYNVALLQLGLNRRIDGIQSLLRRQEDPPRGFSGGWTVNQNSYAKLNKPGGFVSSDNPNAKIETLAPDLPDDLWLDKREYERMFDDMGGFVAVMRGQGDQGIRSQAQAESMIRTASPRFKTRALKIERSVEQVGDLGLAILRARYAKSVFGWVKPGEPPPNAAPRSWWSNFFQSPAPGMERVEFLMHDVPDTYRVRVDSHSSSPAFSYESRELAFALANRGAISNPALIALTHPPQEDALIQDAETADIQRAQFIAQHPEAVTGKKPGAKK